MGLELDILSKKMENLFNNVRIEEKVLSLGILKDDIKAKERLINEFRIKLSRIQLGKDSKRFLNELQDIEVYFNSLYENFDDKLMIFIIGNGNVGKSTLLNALIGYEIAETNFLPNTWKIDIYSTELDKNKAIIKYDNGKQEIMSVDKSKEIIKSEEAKSKEGKRIYNKKLNEELKGVVIKEKREEIKRYLSEKYLYKSKITEVKWAVDKNWIVEKCLLVDTPGLNQNLNDLEQLGNIKDYYHKADGVLWLLDGQTIAAESANSLFEELDGVLHAVGGVRDNIIGVINRMDMVRKDGGEEAATRVINDAKKNYGNKFHRIVDISASKAFEGIKNNKIHDIEQSGILNLQDAIRDIFISKSENVKSTSKIQGCNKLVDLTINILKDFYYKIEKYENMYIEKEKRLNVSKENFKNDLSKDLDNFFETYLNEVAKRVEVHIDELSNGNGANFVKDTIYNIDEFIESRNKFIDNKRLEIKNNTLNWQKFCEISEYKYIKNAAFAETTLVTINENIDLSYLNHISYFTPKLEEDLFSFLGNVFGKAMFWIRKDGIKDKINLTIRSQCCAMKEDILKQLNDEVDRNAILCKEIIEITFKNILFSFKNTKSIKSEIKKVEIKIDEDNVDIKLKDIIL